MDNTPPTAHRISLFNEWRLGKKLDLKPPYQRKPVWTLRNKSYLMDTILNGLPIPEIYMQVKTDPKGNTRYEIVDGQQRLRAILSYINGDYAIMPEESEEFGGMFFADLSDGHKEGFWHYQLVVRELHTNSEEDIRAIFKRLNKNVVPLNAQELRHATYTGHFVKLVETLADNVFWAENKIVSPDQIRRMNDAEFVSELLVGIMEGAQDGTKTLDKFYALYDDQFDDKEQYDKQFRKVRQIIEDVLGDLRGTGWNSKSDFYAMFIAISQLLDNHNLMTEKYYELKDKLITFKRLVNLEKEHSKSRLVREYNETIAHGRTATKENRTRRIEIVKKLIVAFAIPKDPKRGFTEEQRQLIWDLSNDKLCALCSKKVEWDSYEADHIVPHSRGGLTIVSNGQVTHKVCNAAKGKK